MPGALARGRNANAVAVIPRSLVATPYDQGLSHFPDRPWQRAPMGAFSLTQAAPLVAPVPYVGTAANVAAGAYSFYSAIFGDGSTRDRQRAARADYFGQLAMRGNVAAAQILLGAIPNVSGNEQAMWQGWISQLQSSSAGQSTLQQAQALGPYWPVGSTDTVTNYPIMQNFVAQWDAAHPFASVGANLATGASAIVRSSLTPLLLAGGAALAIALTLGGPKRRRRR